MEFRNMVQMNVFAEWEERYRYREWIRRHKGEGRVGPKLGG